MGASVYALKVSAERASGARTETGKLAAAASRSWSVIGTSGWLAAVRSKGLAGAPDAVYTRQERHAWSEREDEVEVKSADGAVRNSGGSGAGLTSLTEGLARTGCSDA